MAYNPVGWFEIPVKDMDRAIKFYTDVFGFEMKVVPAPEGYLMTWFPMGEGEAKGSGGALMKGMGYEPTGSGTVVYFTCPDIEGTIEKAVATGSHVILPMKDIGEYGTIAWISDSEGNPIGLHHR